MESKDENFLNTFREKSKLINEEHFKYPALEDYKTDEEFVSKFKELNANYLRQYKISDYMLYTIIEMDKQLQFLQLIEELEENFNHFNEDVIIIKELKRAYLYNGDLTEHIIRENEAINFMKEKGKILNDVIISYKERITEILKEIDYKEDTGEIYNNGDLTILLKYENEKINKLNEEIKINKEQPEKEYNDAINIMNKIINSKKDLEESIKERKLNAYKEIMELSTKYKNKRAKENNRERLKLKIKEKRKF